MKQSFLVSVFVTLILCLPRAVYANPNSPANVEHRAKLVEIEGSVAADPCDRNPSEACIGIFIYPKAHIEAYQFGGKMEAEVDIEDNANFDLKLPSGEYFFYIENKINNQKAIFGPIDVREDVSRMALVFIMYNSYQPAKPALKDKEICLVNKVTAFDNPGIGPPLALYNDMQCVLATHDK